MDTYTLNQLNELPTSAFVNAFKEVFEHSPWVIEAAAEARPFTHVKALMAACDNALYAADMFKQIEIIKAHPDLAAKLDHLPKLTDFSQAEQKRAGFAVLPDETLDKMRQSLTTYRERFDHPFILCVTEHSAEDVLPILEQRAKAEPAAERLACLFQISRIGWHRICSLISD